MTLRTDDHPPFLSVAEAAVALQVSGHTVRRWIKGGHLHAVQPSGREGGVLRIPASELSRLADGGRPT